MSIKGNIPDDIFLKLIDEKFKSFYLKTARPKGTEFSQAEDMKSFREEPEIPLYRVYILSVKDIMAGGGLDKAIPVSWIKTKRYENNPALIHSVEVGKDKNDNPVHISTGDGPFEKSFFETFQTLLKDKEGANDDYELRLLKIHELYIIAIWLKKGDENIIVPLEPAPNYLVAGKIYSEADFIKLIFREASQIV
jgi:hypothetical protein